MVIELFHKIIKAGGFVNSHSHFDRSYTYNHFTADDAYLHLTEKWQLVDKFKRDADVYKYYQNIKTSIDNQLHYSVNKACTFIDIDSVTGTNALQGAKIARDRNDFELKIACQTLKGVLKKEESDIIESVIEDFDIIGSLPKADKDPVRHIDKVMSWSKKYNKRLHVHVDQLNCASEKETELLARKTIEWGLEGKVTAVHSISLACHPKTYRKEVYNICRDAGLSFVSCPSAWIDHPRRDDLAPIHNAITPVDELLENDLIVGIGSDNINDIYKPYSDGDMMFELRLLLEACKVYDTAELVKIATTNGKIICGFNS